MNKKSNKSKTSQIQVVQMSDSDKKEVISWEERYGHMPEYDSIRQYVLEGDTYHGLKEVVLVNYEIFRIGEDEKQFSFVAKNDNNEVVAWLLCDVFDISSGAPELFIQYIITHPMHQHEGIGKEIAKEILLNPEKYIGVKPVDVFAYVDKSNIASKALFERFGFEFHDMTPKFFRAIAEEPKLLDEHNSKPQEFGE